MTTLQEDSIVALQIFGAIMLFMTIILIAIYAASKARPTDDEIRVRQIRDVESIKLCTDNDLDAYQGNYGHWYCKPKK